MVDKMTHDRSNGDDIVVFLLGFRPNKIWRVDVWMPVLLGQRRMLKELSKDPESGLLGFRTVVGAAGGTSIQYWTDTDKLYAYAADASKLHKTAWIKYYRREKKAPEAVGIWHETFEVKSSETIYGDMPPVGLGAALGLVPISKETMQARQRLGAKKASRTTA